MLISAAAFYGLTAASPANALTEQPIYPDPANSANSCMADAYFDTGGSGMKGTLGEALTVPRTTLRLRRSFLKR